MNLHIKLGLLLALTSYTVADAPFYVPQITIKSILGKLTYIGFSLEQPQCIFHPYNTSDVWLVIALDSVVPNLTETNLSNPVGYNASAYYYHLYQMPGINFPCSDTVPKRSALIPVGVENNCTNIPFCNGILKRVGPYRVKFVVLNNNNTLVNGTRWSEKINLLTGQEISTINAHPGRHSAGMIIITVILSVFLAILLACLIAALINGSKDICWFRKIDNEGFLGKEEIDMSDFVSDIPYIPHSIYKTHSKRYTARESKVKTVTKLS